MTVENTPPVSDGPIWGGSGVGISANECEETIIVKLRARIAELEAENDILKNYKPVELMKAQQTETIEHCAQVAEEMLNRKPQDLCIPAAIRALKTTD